MDGPHRAQGLAVVELSVILPTFNLAGTIRRNLDKVESVLKGIGVPCEMIPVDDGSSDGTPAIIRDWAASGPHRNPVLLERNGGKGNALKAGFRASSGRLVLLLDGDLDILPDCLPGFLGVMEREHADIVIGSKRHPASRVAYHRHPDRHEAFQARCSRGCA